MSGSTMLSPWKDDGVSLSPKNDRELIPQATDGAALGSAAVMWSDLFLALGGVLNWNNGDVTITHAANTLTFAGVTGGYSFDDDISLAAGAARVISVATDNTEGDALSLIAGSGGTGDVNGGALYLTGGAAGSGGNNTGGAVYITGGVDAGTDAGGSVVIRGGAGNTNGSVTIGDADTAAINIGANMAIANGKAIQTGITASDTLLFQAYDNDTGPGYITFITLTAGNSPSCVLASDVTAATQAPGDNSTKIATTAFVTAAVATADTLQEVFDNGQTITVANTDNQTLALVQNDTTNNPAMLTIANTTTGQSVTITHDTVTTGYAVSLSSDGLTTGSAVYLESTSTQGTVSDSSKVLNIARSGANANASHTAYGIYSSVVNSGTTNTNVAGYFTASGGSTANYAIQISGALYDGTATLSSGAWSGITTLAAQAGDFTVADNGNDIPLVVTQNDVTNNPIAASITNAGTESGLYINQTGVLAASKYGLYIYSNSAQINGYLAFIHQANVSSTQRALHVTNEGEGYGVYLHKHTTPLAASRAMLKVYSDVANVNASALVDINEASTTSTHVVLQVNNDGLGTGIYVDSDINNTTAGSFDGILVDFDRIGNVSSGSDTVYGLRLTPTHTGASGGTIATYGVHATVAGDAGGTSTAVGGYFTASGADTNIALETGAGAVKIGAVIHYDAEYDNGNSGAAVTIDWNNGNVQKVTMTDNCTFSFTNPPGPGHYTLRSIQDAGGTNTYTWTGGGLTVAWNAGTEPTWSVVGTEVNIHSFYFDGAAWRGDGWTQS